MKRIALLTFVLLFNFSFAQKKELRKAQKLYDAGDTSGASQILTEFQALLDNSDQKVKPKYLLLKGKITQNNKEYQAAYDILTSIEDASAF
mgnify:FL=1